MKIIKKKVHPVPIEFSSANEIIKVKLYIEDGPEVELEDLSLIIFTDVSTYYAIGTDEIDINGIKKYLVMNDDVSSVTYENKELLEVEQYKYNDRYFYRFIM